MRSLNGSVILLLLLIFVYFSGGEAANPCYYKFALESCTAQTAECVKFCNNHGFVVGRCGDSQSCCCRETTARISERTGTVAGLPGFCRRPWMYPLADCFQRPERCAVFCKSIEYFDSGNCSDNQTCCCSPKER